MVCRQTDNPATYQRQNGHRIRQVSGWEAISGLKGGLFLADVSPQLPGSSYFSSTILMDLVCLGRGTIACQAGSSLTPSRAMGPLEAGQDHRFGRLCEGHAPR